MHNCTNSQIKRGCLYLDLNIIMCRVKSLIHFSTFSSFGRKFSEPIKRKCSDEYIKLARSRPESVSIRVGWAYVLKCRSAVPFHLSMSFSYLTFKVMSFAFQSQFAPQELTPFQNPFTYRRQFFHNKRRTNSKNVATENAR